MLIGVNGKIWSGKDTVCKIIQSLNPDKNFENKKFAGKLKEVAGIILGVNPERFEEQSFKNSLLGSEWTLYKLSFDTTYSDKIFSTYKLFSTGQEMYDYARANRLTLCKYEAIEPTVRQFLQWLGTDAIRDHLHPNTWVNALMQEHQEDSNWVITDMRFDNEFQAVKLKEGITIKVIRPQTEQVSYHISERELDNHEFDYLIINDGDLHELQKTIEQTLYYVL